MLDLIGLKYLLGENDVDFSYRGGDKTSFGKNLVSDYDSIFSPIMNDKLKFLEIGIWTGCSIAMWSEYFSNSIIYGVDCSFSAFNKSYPILLDKGAFKNKKIVVYPWNYPDLDQLIEGDINLFECNTLKKYFVYLIHNYFPKFDIILDDGDHRPESQYRNFKILFNQMNDNGIYIIEDILNPKKFYSHKYFGNIVSLINGFTTDQLFKEYLHIKKRKNQLKYDQLQKDLLKLNQNIILSSHKTHIQFLINKKDNLEISIKLIESNDIEKFIKTKFDQLLKQQLLLFAQIGRIQNCKDSIIFFKKSLTIHSTE